ncbi:hypothetical protein LOS78_12695 [Paracoccus sp. MA]|uniref:hypothetical protein n=1 Tax=Paracoccus sp. MA TaxID=2895796 RepID=UPI001E35AB0D|nr:hypothetical protein [Paracoccus sp. MA]UFM66784.1 hypothetical protein LOS78_12695 [Paracoccus sp. MA]
MATVRIDTGALERRLRVAPSKIKRVARNSLNDTAKELRAATPDIMKRVIDRPTPFTSKPSAVLYKAASYEDLTSSLRFNRIQARYLGPGEFGERAERIHTPIHARVKEAKFGNLGKKWRWSPAERAKLLAAKHVIPGKRTATREIGQYFFGRPRGAYTKAGLFHRPKDPSKPLQRLTVFTQTRRYREIFGIRKEWRRLGGPMLERHLQIQANHPANRL